MILLPAQFQLLFYHLISGWLAGFSYQFVHAIKVQFKTVFFRNLIDFLWVTFCVFLFYLGLFHLNGGETQFYCLVFLLFGFLIYMKFYFPVLHPLTVPLSKMFMRFSLVFSNFFCIIKMRKKRRALFGSSSNKKDKAKKNQRSCPESD
ncbi:MAG: hypothetical protein E7192_00920 [Erysipelotrichaceae bacterium]|nr:hypothetical protein [Erysipelotrichaceae bacterium]